MIKHRFAFVAIATILGLIATFGVRAGSPRLRARVSTCWPGRPRRASGSS